MLNNDRQPVTLTATTLDELLALHDEHFIRCAYLAVLSRAPDADGLAYYLKRLRSGVPKLEILAQLRFSREVHGTPEKLTGLDAAIINDRRNPVTKLNKLISKSKSSSFAQYKKKVNPEHSEDEKLPGLDKVLYIFKWSQKPLVGWIIRFFYNLEGDSAAERKLREIENKLFLMSEENKQQHKRLETTFAALHNLVTQQAHVVATAVGGALQSNTDYMESLSPVQQLDTESLKRLSPQARDIFYKLTSASLRNLERTV